MIIIIDGYNVIKQVYQEEYITKQQRTAFVQQLNKYAKKKGHELLVVFDGGRYGMPSRSHKNQITVVYTGAQERADDYIIRYIKQHKAYDILVVSTDREITAVAQHTDVPYIDSALFYEFVLAALPVSAQKKRKRAFDAQKLHPHKEQPELDALMETVVVPHKPEEELEPDDRKARKKTLSKNKRRLARIIDKL